MPWASFAACTRCGGVLEIVHDAPVARSSALPARRGTDPVSLQALRALIALPEDCEPVSMGEGGTPLVPSLSLTRRFSRPVYWKNETMNPTWSHKDRFHAVAMSWARALGYRTVGASSTGNHGVSAAAYAARAGLAAVVLYPPETPAAFLHLTGVYGGQAVVTGWAARAHLLETMVQRHAWYRLDGRNPFGIEGYKAIAWEIVADLGDAPQAVVIPVASGKLLWGVHTGFRQMRDMGWISRLPRIVACQPRAADVLGRSLAEGHADAAVLADAYSVALSTRERTCDSRVLTAIRESGGRVVAVAEADIVAAVAELGREGLAVEPASAMVAAATRIHLETDDGPGGITVGIVTSALVKSPDLLAEMSAHRPWRVGVEPAELDALVTESPWLAQSSP